MRRFVLPLLLVVVALAAAVGAWALERPEEAQAAEPDDGPGAVTPVLSPRRVPLWLLQPGGDERLRLAVQPVLDQSPPDTCLVVADGGRRIVAQQPDLAVVPASNQKLVTGQVALDVLGADFRYRTTVVARAVPVDGVVEGDLWLVGGGDPVLTTGDFLAGFREPPAHTSLEDLADAVVAAGVTTVTGSVIGDDSRYDGQDAVPDWTSRDYGTESPGPLDALVVNRGYSTYRTDPDEVVVPQASSDAPASAAQRLIELLEERDVDVQGSNGSDQAPAEAVELAAVDSPPLADIVGVLERQSDNTIAELLVKELGYAEEGEGSTAAGLEVMRRAVEASGLPAEGLVFADGSGLHADNRLTCAYLVGLLEEAGPDSDLAAGLAVAGESGTLEDRLEGAAAGRVRAKTGSLRETSALSGFATTVGGYELAFSYVANAKEVPESVLDLEELLASVLVAYPEGPTPAEVAPLPAAP